MNSSGDPDLKSATSRSVLEPGHSLLHKQLCDNLFDGVYFVDEERRVTYWNGGAEALTGFTKSEAVGRHCFDNFLNHVDERGSRLCHNGCPLSASLRDGKRRECEVYLQHKSGHRVPISVRVSPVVDDWGTIIGAVEVFSDISTQKRLERRARELESIASTDPLTGASNRRDIWMKVQQEMLEVQEFGRTSGLLVIDVDHFKKVNDSFGHAAGDAVLKAISDTLTRTLRLGDNVGRWGGEEFLLIAKNVGSKELAIAAERYRRLIATSSVCFDSQVIEATVSIGAALLTSERTAEATFQKADALMYVSKSGGRNRSSIE